MTNAKKKDFTTQSLLYSILSDWIGTNMISDKLVRKSYLFCIFTALTLMLVFMPCKVSLAKSVTDIEKSLFIRIEKGLITAHIQNIPIHQVFKDISNKTDIDIYMSKDIDKIISARFESLSLEEGFKRILGSLDHAMVFNKNLNLPEGNKYVLREVSLFIKGHEKDLVRISPSENKKYAQIPKKLSKNQIQMIELFKDAVKRKDHKQIAELRNRILNLGKAAIPLLYNIVSEGKDDDTREIAALLLAEIGDQEAAFVLADIINDTEEENLRRNFSLALAQIRNESAIPALEYIIRNDEDTFLRDWSARALSNIGTKEATLTLAELIEGTEDTEQGDSLMYSMARIRNKESIPILINLVRESENESIVKAATNAVEGIGDKTAIKILEKVADSRKTRTKGSTYHEKD